MKLRPEALCSTPANRFIEAYRNPRLVGPDKGYMGPQHIQELQAGSTIIDWRDLQPKLYENYGIMRPFTMVTEQGYGYRGAIGIPRTQRGKTAVSMTSPLGVAPEGYPRHVMLNYMRAGSYVMYLASEGSYKPDTSYQAKSPITIANSASAQLNMNYHVLHELRAEGHDVSDEDIIASGSSRAGAIALTMNALDERFGMNVSMSDVIAPAPCLRLNTLKQWRTLGEQIVSEPAKTTRIIARLGISLAYKYRKSVTVSPYELQHHVEIFGGLLNGEMDAAASRIPGDKIIRISEFDGDRTCNDGGLEKRLKPETHPYVWFDEHRGIHMSIIDKPLVMSGLMGFIKASQEYEKADIANAQTFRARVEELTQRQTPLTTTQIPHPTDLIAS